MHINSLKAIFKTAVQGAAVLLFGAGAASAQQVSLTAAPTNAIMPDGSTVPMWGYSCGAVSGNATCAALNPASTGWSPVVITVPMSSSLTINLTNKLSFTPAGGGSANNIPTSLMIVGQLGGGLGDTTQRTADPSPNHMANQSVTWPTVGGGNFTPPNQPDRVRSFGTEVTPGNTVTLPVWKNLRPGTYLIESGTHPSIQGPMGLYGILVVTNAPSGTTAGTAYPNVSYNADVAMLMSEIDPVQNAAVNAAVNTNGFSEMNVWSGLAGSCGDPTAPSYNTCYPPVVNYSPTYYMINGVAFSRANASASMIAPLSGSTATSGNVLVRFVNAGLRMHVPAIVGSATGTPAAGGFSLIAEDGNVLPGIPRVQNEVFMAAGKTYDVMVNMPAAGASALPVYDRELSLSGNKINRDAGMLAYLGLNGAALPNASDLAAAQANPDTYSSVVPGITLTISDASKGLLANDVNVYGAAVASAPAHGTLTLDAKGTFTYVPDSTWGSGTTSDSFTYMGNGNSGLTALVTLNVCTGACLEAAGGITMNPITYYSTVATALKINSPGVLSVDSDGAGHPLKVVIPTTPIPLTGPGTGTLIMDANGGFNANVSSPGTYTFTYHAQNSQGTVSANAATVTLVFPQGSNLQVNVVDGQNQSLTIGDYRWIIEEDQTFFVDPGCANNPPPTTSAITGQPCINAKAGIIPTFGTNFHTSHMPFVAQGCTGPKSCESGQTVLHQPAVCDGADGVCRTTVDATTGGQTAVMPSQVALDPTKRYYISVLPGDAADPFYGAGSTGHSMGGAEIPAGQAATGKPVTVLAEATPFQPAKLSVFVFEDDFPLNGENDAGGGVDVLAPNEPGLGGFNIQLWDAMGGNGDFTGQMTYDMFNQPLANSLAGTIDPVSGFDACPLTPAPLSGTANPAGTAAASAMTGMIVTCPKYEADGKTLSPLAGQAVVANLMPGRFGIVATPGADRIARNEEWHQTNTLDGQKAHDSFMRVGEPSYFQEFGPASYHVTIGFANPAIISARGPQVCAGLDINLSLNPGDQCVNTVKGHVSTERMSRTPDERLYGSGNWNSFNWTQCFVSLGDPDGEDFAFTKCDENGNFTFNKIPPGDWRVTVFDKWNDLLVDGLSTPVGLTGGAGTAKAQTLDMGEIAMNQWQSNVYTRTFVDDNKDGVWEENEGGIPLIPVAVRYRDGSLANGLSTDFTGQANFNETFPLFNWYVVETDTTRYKNTGTHTVYDAGGPADGTASCGSSTNQGYPACGTSTAYANMANTNEQNPLPSDLSIPGAVYCPVADCANLSIQNAISSNALAYPSKPGVSTGRIDPPWVGGVEGWQGFSGQNNFIEFGKEPYVPGENGGIKGHVVYASTRPFDDPQMLVQTQWEPLVPHVTINLYKEGTAADGTQSLTLVDTTQTSSFDDWAQGFRKDANGNFLIAADGKSYIPNMNCPGQTTSDMFYFSIEQQPNYLDVYNNVLHGTASGPMALPYQSQFKCYDGMHNWNQLQPAPYDGMYKFPSVTSVDPVSGKPTGTNCTICKANNLSATTLPTNDLYYGLPQLPAGKYVVEVVVPPGYELVKEEDKNILIGDNFIAPVTQEFGALGDVFILPDQATVASNNNPYNAQNPTTNLGATPNNGIVPGFVPEPTWPCVGEARTVPDYISLFPQSQQVAPFAGAVRNLCDRKEVTLGDQMGAIAKFYVYTSTHIASKFTGIITDDFTSEFDPFSPQFGEKFSPPDLPVSIRDWTGAETNRVYADHWGTYNGLSYSTWEVNPPNPTGYSPTMMVTCMNDRGDAATADPLFNPGYSQFCYELPYMPGQTGYFDTPVVPTSAFSAGYNHPDCAYPDATPAIAEVAGDGTGAHPGPWVDKVGATLTITGLGDQQVNNYAYSGPSATAAPFNAKTITRHYGFGNQCTTSQLSPISATCNTLSSVTIGGVSAPITKWTDGTITVTVPSKVPNCALQQQAQYGGSTAQCGQLVITAGNGKQSVDSVMVTIGGKAPTYVSSTTPLTPTGVGAIQQAIDAAAPGDLIIVPPGTYYEMVVMWKPVRLQGVGAATSIIDAKTQPAGKLDPWRSEIECFFGLASSGQPNNSAGSKGCSANLKYFSGSVTGNGASTVQDPQVDRLPLEGVLGWDTSVNGNLAQLLQEPTLMGAYEGAGITILSKGVNVHGQTGYYGTGTTESAFPTGTTVLTANDCGSGTPGARGYVKNPYPSNFWCNPSLVDGLTITDSSQGGGGIFAHAWAHNLEVSNNRVYGNIGTLSGGINIGQGESPDIYSAGTAADSDPGSCRNVATDPTGLELPYCFNMFVKVHNNLVTSNTSIGDELFSGTPAGAGGVTFCTGADYYKFQFNWVCGNQSTGDGGGVAHLGFIWDGDIEHNSIIFNQSTNPTIATNGGGLIVMGAAPDGFTAAGVECGGTAADADCAPGLPDGTGPGLTINANLFQGNAAESGSGGGIRFQSVNGTEIATFPDGTRTYSLRGQNVPPLPSQTIPAWNTVTVTNNIIVNNVAGWDGAGVSLQDALAVNLINNTIASNDTTASSGVLFNTLGAPLASAPGAPPNQQKNGNGTGSLPQPAGLVTMQNSANLSTTLPANLKCPVNNAGSKTTGNCSQFSIPYLANDLFWQNRAFDIGVGNTLDPAHQQYLVTLFNAFTTTPAPTQPQAESTVASGNGQIITGGTGACTAASYWDIGARGDTGPGNHNSGLTLKPNYSLLTSPGVESAAGVGNIAVNPNFLSQYCNGSRTPPEAGSNGYQVPPGISDATVPNPYFSLSPSATVDEGNNWINISWGPLTLSNPISTSPAFNSSLGNYALSSGSPAIDTIATNAPTYAIAPPTDFYGNPRPDLAHSNIDVGAVEFQAPNYAIATVSPTSLAFGSVATGTTSAAQTLTLSNTGGAALTGINVAVTAPFSRATGAGAGTCGATLAAGTSCTINVVFTPAGLGAASGTATIGGSVAVTGSPVSLTGTGVVPTAIASVTGGPLAFGNVVDTTTSTPQTLTLHNTGNAPLTGINLVFSSPRYSRAAAAGTCGANLAAGATCTINVVFSPTSPGLVNATLAIAGNVTITGSPVALSGTGVAAVVAATLTPTTWSPSQTRNCPGAACLLDPVQAFTLTNTGNVNLTGIAQGALGGTNASEFTVTRLLSTCGPGGNGQILGLTNLAPGATCTVTVRFTPLTAQSTGIKNATISVTDAAGTQTSTLTGTAN